MKRTLESNLGHTVFVPKNTVTVWLSRSVLPSLPQVHPNQEHTDSRNITKLVRALPKLFTASVGHIRTQQVSASSPVMYTHTLRSTLLD